MKTELFIKSIYRNMPCSVASTIRYIYIFFRAPYLKCNYHKVKKRKNSLKQIIVMGDSHATFFSGDTGTVGSKTKTIKENYNWGSIEYEPGPDARFCVLRLGPGLAYNLVRYGTNVKVLEKFEWLDRHFLKGNERIIFAFGEIDIRTHVFRYTSDSKSYKDVIDEIINNYISFLLKVKKGGYYVYVWGPIASQKDEWKVNDDYPRTGNEIQRNMATEYFNDTLKTECGNNGIGFMSVYYDLIDEYYRTNDEYIFDQCHLGQNARPFLEIQLEKAGLNCYSYFAERGK